MCIYVYFYRRNLTKVEEAVQNKRIFGKIYQQKTAVKLTCFSGVSQITTLPDSAVTTLSPVGVMTAWVTMAPRGASAS